MATVKDLQIDSPVYRVSLDKIEIAHVSSIFAYDNGTRKFSFKPSWMFEYIGENVGTELTYKEHKLYVNIEEAQFAQQIIRSEYVERLKQEMESIQKQCFEAINRFAFANPSKPIEL